MVDEDMRGKIFDAQGSIAWEEDRQTRERIRREEELKAECKPIAEAIVKKLDSIDSIVMGEQISVLVHQNIGLLQDLLKFLPTYIEAPRLLMDRYCEALFKEITEGKLEPCRTASYNGFVYSVPKLMKLENVGWPDNFTGEAEKWRNERADHYIQQYKDWYVKQDPKRTDI